MEKKQTSLEELKTRQLPIMKTEFKQISCPECDHRIKIATLTTGPYVRQSFEFTSFLMNKFHKKETLYVRDTNPTLRKLYKNDNAESIQTLVYYPDRRNPSRGNYHLQGNFFSLTSESIVSDEYVLGLIRGNYIGDGLEVIDIYGATNK